MENTTYDRNLVENLNDLELACLVCLVSDQHCIIRASEDTLDDVASQIESISSVAFGYTCATLDCTPDTSLEEFCDGVIEATDADIENDGVSQGPLLGVQFQSTRTKSWQTTNVLDSRKVTNVVVAKNLDQTARSVQIQALELMRSRRIYSRSAVHAAPKRFLFICLISTILPEPPYLTPYLNDYLFICHTHVTGPSETDSQADTASISSFSSLARKPSASPKPLVIPRHEPIIADDTITQLQKLTSGVRMTTEIRRYIHNIPTFLRLHRAVSGGVSALSSRHLNLLTRVLASLHNQAYVTPSLVPLAAEKVLAHRVELVKHAIGDRSMLWGSNEDAVEEYLAHVRVEMGVLGVLGEVIDNVPAPL